MKRTLLPAGGHIFLTVVLFAAVVTASRPAFPLAALRSARPASSGAAEDDPKGTVWVVSRDLGELACSTPEPGIC
jgi:hypothetical protein